MRGELTLVVEGAAPGLDAEPPACGVWEGELKALLQSGLSSREAASAIAARFNLPRRVVYQAALTMKKGGET